MKRSYDAVTSSSRQTSSSVSDGPVKDEPLKTENNAFVRSILRSIDDVGGDGGDGDGGVYSDDDIIGDQRQQRQQVNISEHVASSWKRLDSYCSWGGERSSKHPPSKPPSQEAKMEAISVFYKVSDYSRSQGYG